MKISQKQLANTNKEIGNILDKFNWDNNSGSNLGNDSKISRRKRGLVNLLGTTIKFIAGNPDADDLNTINNNLDSLFKNQHEVINKLNQFASVANHISKRLELDTLTINRNLAYFDSLFNKYQQSQERLSLLQNELFQSNALLGMSLTIERTISFALRNIPNLELVSLEEIRNIRNYLFKVYTPAQLLPYDNEHLFEILSFGKMNVMSIHEMLTFILKIPILKPYPAAMSRIYPLPNYQQIILQPPKKYLMEIEHSDFWTDEDCATSNGLTLCIMTLLSDPCELKNISTCVTAIVVNSYRLIETLKNGQLLVMFSESTEVLEDCHNVINSKNLNGSLLLHSPCRLIIGKCTYVSTVPRFNISLPEIDILPLETSQSITLRSRHLSSPADIQEEVNELFTPLHLQPEIHGTHYVMSSMSLIFIIGALATLCWYRKRLIQLICSPLEVVTVDPPNAAVDVNT